MKHEMSIVHPDAKIGKNVVIGPFTTIGKDVVIGDDTWIGANVSIMSDVTLGEKCKVYQGAILGSPPQDLKFENEESVLEIGSNVIIREYCTINKGTIANYKTIIGDNTLLMAYVHVAHDCIVGKNCILANNVNLAGHIEVGDFAILGGLTAVHQFVKIGPHAFVGGGSLVRKDIPPYVKGAREPLSYCGVNSIGLRRRGFSNERINHIQNIYRILFVKGYNFSQAIRVIETTIPASQDRHEILSFLNDADRGLMRGFKK